MTHSRIIVQKGRELFHKDCLVEDDATTSEVPLSSLDQDDFCVACNDPLVSDAADDSDKDDEEDD